MMETTSITASAARDEFLLLLTTQLRNQDPLQPVAQHDFISQLAQFSTLEGIEKLNTRFDDLLDAQQAAWHIQELTSGASLIGKTVEYQPLEGVLGTEQGVVDAIAVQEGRIVLRIADRSVPVDRVRGVLAPSRATGGETEGALANTEVANG